MRWPPPPRFLVNLCALASRILILSIRRRWVPDHLTFWEEPCYLLARWPSGHHSQSWRFVEEKSLGPAGTGAPECPAPTAVPELTAVGIQYVSRCTGEVLVSVLMAADACETGSSVNSFTFIWVNKHRTLNSLGSNPETKFFRRFISLFASQILYCMVGWLLHWIFNDVAVYCRMIFGKNCVQWNVKQWGERTYRVFEGRHVTIENQQKQTAVSQWHI